MQPSGLVSGGGQREADDRLLAKDNWEDVTSMASPVPLPLLQVKLTRQPLLPAWHSAGPCWPQMEAALEPGVGQSPLPETSWQAAVSGRASGYPSHKGVRNSYKFNKSA